MSKIYYPVFDGNICKTCANAKDRFRESCFCTEYGIMIAYGKRDCNGYDRKRKENSDGTTGTNFREAEERQEK